MSMIIAFSYLDTREKTSGNERNFDMTRCNTPNEVRINMKNTSKNEMCNIGF